MATRKPVSLKYANLYQACDLRQFDFKTTADLELLDQPLGQDRALEAIEFGVDIDQQGFNLFVLGNTGLGKHELVQQILSRQAQDLEARNDWCYVNNFENPQRPRLLKLPAGMGQQLRADMETLVEDLLTLLPSSFQSEEYQSRRQEIEQELQDQQEQVFHELDKEAEEKGIIIMRTPGGYTMGPMVDGHLLDQQGYAKLPDDEKQRIEKVITDLQAKLQAILQQMPLVQREHLQRIKALNQEITEHTVEQLIAWMENSYRDHPDVMQYLQAVKENAIKGVNAFLPSEQTQGTDNIASRVAEFHAFSINVILDNTDTRGAPIMFEDNPTYQNLIGRVEYVSQMGTLLTNFTLIKPGALHRANGGYLILDAFNLLRHGFAWEGLKGALKSGEIKIQSLEQMLSLVNTVSLEPESMPLDVKVILVGEPWLYYLLRSHDHEFEQLFKVSADFAQTTKRDTESMLGYARMIAAVQQKSEVRPLNKAGVGRIIEEASRNVGDTEKLSLHMDDMRDLVNEANYWAGKANRKIIGLADVEQAIEKQTRRQDRYRELLQEQVLRGIKLIDTEGSRVAQVNALSLLQVGGYRFGQASRITATARLGRSGVVDIEREAKLGGEIHSKGVMILSSYLAHRYAANQPLPLAASLAFEQSYGMVDGDSASAAELCALLSALGEIPLKQSLAVTGSINQLGEIQAIGGVNEKIEGFFEICTARELNKEQGVIIPAANQAHLMLHKDVREAVKKGAFNIYVAEQVEDVMRLLTGLEPGKADASGNYPQKSFNYRVQQRIKQLQSIQKQFAQRNGNGNSPAKSDKK
ncbi:MAG: AAA family ATPase [Gammaproteobacteria bacterium]|nr:AAA family ATPase [Gammaproteobacteria bacterium]MDH3858582.1 AAA family ATPase [Gammaproteobacteria bacterium]